MSASTVPANGDVNPYGVAFVPGGFPEGGLLRGGDVIVANFNNSANLQGTGTTIVRVNANASPSLFFQDSSFPGFSTALGALRRGLVLVGNLPSTNGSGSCTEGAEGQEENVGHGAVLVIDKDGRLVQVLSSRVLLDGPWDLTILDEGNSAHIFVANALSGAVTRIDALVGGEGLVIEDAEQIASGYTHRCDPAAFVVGPTGVALDQESDVLYVASAGDNAIYAVPDALRRTRDTGTGSLVVSDAVHLHGPLGLALAPNGDLISAQGDAVNFDPNQPSEIVEFTATGSFVSEFSIDSAPGSAFGLALEVVGPHFRFAAVDDGINVLDIWNVP
ncbi:MAG TPA: hypothetical protein VEK07_19000 [Polyangiaceae bacterium]|nr:hypothetical protein [Polyangiaceae bacterium]